MKMSAYAAHDDVQRTQLWPENGDDSKCMWISYINNGSHASS